MCNNSNADIITYFLGIFLYFMQNMRKQCKIAGITELLEEEGIVNENNFLKETIASILLFNNKCRITYSNRNEDFHLQV